MFWQKSTERIKLYHHMLITTLVNKIKRMVVEGWDTGSTLVYQPPLRWQILAYFYGCKGGNRRAGTQGWNEGRWRCCWTSLTHGETKEKAPCPGYLQQRVFVRTR